MTGMLSFAHNAIICINMIVENHYLAVRTQLARTESVLASGKQVTYIIRRSIWSLHLCFGCISSTGLEKFRSSNLAFVVLVDEASMLDTWLCSALMKSLLPACQILFIGDINQLPPVGAGHPLRALLRCGVCPVIELKEVFRQSLGSDIVKAAYNINSGAWKAFCVFWILHYWIVNHLTYQI